MSEATRRTRIIFLYPAYILCFWICSTTLIAQDIKSISKEDSLETKAPHRGRLELNGNYYLELVNNNHMLAFYLYDTDIKPVSNKNIKGSVVVKSINKVFTNLNLRGAGMNGFSPGNAVFNNFSSCSVTLTIQGKAYLYKFKDIRINMVQYTCPVHPEIVKNEPGQCPKCGLELVEKKELAKNPGGANEK